MPRREYNNKMQQLQGYLDAAKAANEAGNKEEYRKQMDLANALKPQVLQLQQDLETMDFMAPPAAGGAVGQPDVVTNLANTLIGGGRVSLQEIANALGRPLVSNSVVFGSSTATGTGTVTEVRGGDLPMTDMIPRADHVVMETLGSLLIPYVKTEAAAEANDPAAKAGQLRNGSTDPVFGTVELAPCEVTLTLYVDKNLPKLSPVNFLTKVLQLADRARIRKINDLMVNGDGKASPKMFGVLNAKDADGASMVRDIDISGIDENTLSKIMFSYSGNESMGVNPELHLTKEDLQAFAEINGANEKKSVYAITFDGNGNSGIISKGAQGLGCRFVLDSRLTPVATAAAGDEVMFYGDPSNYSLGVYGDATIRLDESYKAGERLLTILVDQMTAGNVSVQNGFTVVKKAAATVQEPDAEGQN